MSERKMLSTVNKTLLKNVIRHTDSHNKVVEETEMWRQRKKQLNHSDPTSTRNSFLKDRGVDMKYEFSNNRERRAHMDDEPRSTYWMNELYKAEEADGNRWGHSGFKELYPEKFASGSAGKRKRREGSHDQYERTSSNTHRSRRDSSDSVSSGSDYNVTEKKHKDRRKRKEKSKRKKRKKRKHSDTDSNVDSDSDDEREKKKRKKKHKHKDKKKRKKRKRKSSDSDS